MSACSTDIKLWYGTMILLQLFSCFADRLGSALICHLCPVCAPLCKCSCSSLRPFLLADFLLSSPSALCSFPPLQPLFTFYHQNWELERNYWTVFFKAEVVGIDQILLFFSHFTPKPHFLDLQTLFLPHNLCFMMKRDSFLYILYKN